MLFTRLDDPARRELAPLLDALHSFNFSVKSSCLVECIIFIYIQAKRDLVVRQRLRSFTEVVRSLIAPRNERTVSRGLRAPVWHGQKLSPLIHGSWN